MHTCTKYERIICRVSVSHRRVGVIQENGTRCRCTALAHVGVSTDAHSSLRSQAVELLCLTLFTLREQQQKSNTPRAPQLLSKQWTDICSTEWEDLGWRRALTPSLEAH